MKVMMIICCTVPASISTIRGCWLIDVLVFQRQKLIFRSNGLSWATSGGVTADACSASFLSLSHSLVTRAFHANREDRIFWICVDLLKFLSSSELSCQSFCILSDICTFEPLLSKCTANLQALVWKLCALLFLIQHLPSGRASFSLLSEDFSICIGSWRKALSALFFPQHFLLSPSHSLSSGDPLCSDHPSGKTELVETRQHNLLVQIEHPESRHLIWGGGVQRIFTAVIWNHFLITVCAQGSYSSERSAGVQRVYGCELIYQLQHVCHSFVMIRPPLEETLEKHWQWEFSSWSYTKNVLYNG